MTQNEQHYYSDRILRAHVRGDAMSKSQREDLHDEITSKDPPKDLADAAQALLAGSTTDDQVKALYKAHKVEGFDVQKFRVDAAPKPSESAVRDAKLAALLNS